MLFGFVGKKEKHNCVIALLWQFNKNNVFKMAKFILFFKLEFYANWLLKLNVYIWLW